MKYLTPYQLCSSNTREGRLVHNNASTEAQRFAHEVPAYSADALRRYHRGTIGTGSKNF